MGTRFGHSAYQSVTEDEWDEVFISFLGGLYKRYFNVFFYPLRHQS